MSERQLSVMIYRDSVTPEVSSDCAAAGLEIVREIAPWLRLEREQRVQRIGTHEDFINVDAVAWPRQGADVNIVLTRRSLLDDSSIGSDGRPNSRRLDQNVGWAFHWDRVNSRRVALVDVRGIRRPEHIVAHEVGHLLGVQTKDPSLHCNDKNCLMFPTQFTHGRADRSFCNCCSEQLFENAQKLRQAKAGRLALARNARIF